MSPEPSLRTLKGNLCQVHLYHRPTPLRTVLHHIFPLGDGGPDTKDNLIKVCDTGHYNIHAAYDQLKHGFHVNQGTRKEREIAQRGYEAYRASFSSK